MKTLENKCPCKGCITFPICKNIVIKTIEDIDNKDQIIFPDDFISFCVALKLESKCSIVKRYFRTISSHYSGKLLIETFNLWKGR